MRWGEERNGWVLRRPGGISLTHGSGFIDGNELGQLKWYIA
jgi:hypothetical protein